MFTVWKEQKKKWDSTAHVREISAWNAWENYLRSPIVDVTVALMILIAENYIGFQKLGLVVLAIIWFGDICFNSVESMSAQIEYSSKVKQSAKLTYYKIEVKI